MINNSKYIIIQRPKDRQARYHTLEQDIRVLTAEIYRLSKLPYASWKNKDRIRSLDKQIEYLEHMLAEYQKAQKGFE